MVLENSRQYPLKAGDVQHVAGEADAYRFSPERIASQVLGELLLAGDGDHFRCELLAEDPRRSIALDASQGTTAKRTVDMDVAIGEKFRTGAYRRQHNEVAALCVDLLAAADGRGDHAGRAVDRLGRLGRSLRCQVDLALASPRRRQHR